MMSNTLFFRFVLFQFLKLETQINEWGGQGLSYTVSGTTGLQLHLKNGNKILIGTQRGDELTRILTQLNKI